MEAKGCWYAKRESQERPEEKSGFDLRLAFEAATLRLIEI